MTCLSLLFCVLQFGAALLCTVRKLLLNPEQNITRQPSLLDRPPGQLIECPQVMLRFLPKCCDIFCHPAPSRQARALSPGRALLYIGFCSIQR